MEKMKEKLREFSKKKGEKIAEIKEKIDRKILEKREKRAWNRLISSPPGGIIVGLSCSTLSRHHLGTGKVFNWIIFASIFSGVLFSETLPTYYKWRDLNDQLDEEKNSEDS